MTDPKKGTGKKPKGSGRRLYTDENPKDTVKIKFATPADARATVAKVKRINKPYARKIQILTVMEQRAKVMGKTQVAARCATRWEKIMAKIIVTIPEPKPEYDVSNQRQILEALDTLKNQLNFSFQADFKNEQDTFNWFIS